MHVSGHRATGLGLAARLGHARASMEVRRIKASKNSEKKHLESISGHSLKILLACPFGF
jgi:hypothetical protein